MFEGRTTPDGKITSHDGPYPYIAYIVAGHDVVRNYGPGGSEAPSFDFGPDDVIVFGFGTMHDWTNRDEGIVFIGFQRPNSEE